MKQGVVKFSKEFVTETGLKEWIGLEWDVDTPFDEAKAMEIFTKVKDFVCNYKGAGKFASFDSAVPPGPPPIIQIQPEDRVIGVTVDMLDSCTDVATLDAYRFIVKGKDDLQRAFDKHRSRLVARDMKNKKQQ